MPEDWREVPTSEDWRDLVSLYRVILRARTGKRIVESQPPTRDELARERSADWLRRLSGNKLIIAKVDGRCDQLAGSMLAEVNA